VRRCHSQRLPPLTLVFASYGEAWHERRLAEWSEQHLQPSSKGTDKAAPSFDASRPVLIQLSFLVVFVKTAQLRQTAAEREAALAQTAEVERLMRDAAFSPTPREWVLEQLATAALDTEFKETLRAGLLADRDREAAAREAERLRVAAAAEAERVRAAAAAAAEDADRLRAEANEAALQHIRGMRESAPAESLQQQVSALGTEVKDVLMKELVAERERSVPPSAPQ
jgi:translation initiation factor IF-2